ncbi:MAG: ribosomal L7Ae/L30e/S12e/Gadd45 family protein [Gemmatimonadaceae bacterium]
MTTDAAQTRRVLGLLGLGVRGRRAVVGVERVRDAVKKGTVRVAVVAADASRHSLDKIVGLLEARHVPTLRVESAGDLGAAVGRETTAVVGVMDAQLAKGILAAVGTTAALQSGSRRKG